MFIGYGFFQHPMSVPHSFAGRPKKMSSIEICPKWLYLTVFFLAMVNGMTLLFSRATLDLSSAAEQALVLLILMAVAFFVRSGARKKSDLPYWQTIVWRLCEGSLFLQIAWINLRLLNHLTMMLPFPYADGLLLGWDEILNSPWQEYFDFVVSNPMVFLTLDMSYTSLTSVSFATMIVLCFFRDVRRVRFFIEIFFTTAVFCIVVGAAFPAKAAVATLITDISGYNIDSLPGIYHLEHLYRLRSFDPVVILNLNELPGLVTFPSFHTASGILLMFAFWRSRFFIPALVYSIIMIASTPIFGGHYFVDLISGTMVALAIGFAFAHRPYYAGMFGSIQKRNLRVREPQQV